MWKLCYKGSWAPKNWCFWTVVLEKYLESILNCKEIQSIHTKGNQSWIFIGSTDADAETPIFWSPDAKDALEKILMLGKIEFRRRGWQRMRWLDGITDLMDLSLRLNGHEFGQALGVGDGQGSLACWSPWSHRVTHGWATELDWWVIFQASRMLFYLLLNTLFQIVFHRYFCPSVPQLFLLITLYHDLKWFSILSGHWKVSNPFVKALLSLTAKSHKFGLVNLSI